MLNPKQLEFLSRAIELSRSCLSASYGGPFGAVIVRQEQIIAEGRNLVTHNNDPTAHAEIVAIRDACNHLQRWQLNDCEIYSSCEPCPMCLGALYWARIGSVIFANSRKDAAAIDFDDEYIYQELDKPTGQRAIHFIHYPTRAAKAVFDEWKNKADRLKY